MGLEYKLSAHEIFQSISVLEKKKNREESLPKEVGRL
jgi:hypothetical protein